MALREILTVGEDVLRKKSKEVTVFDDRLQTLIDDMEETMRFEGRGIGLAAPQVGVLKRLFVVDIHDEHGFLVFVNPVITAREGVVISSEGCLSVPGRSGTVERPESIVIEAQDRHGKPFTLEADGLLAVCICHEYDHLEGVLFIDKLVEEEVES